MMKGIMYVTIPIIFKIENFIPATNLSKNDVKLTIATRKDIYKICNFQIV